MDTVGNYNVQAQNRKEDNSKNDNHSSKNFFIKKVNHSDNARKGKQENITKKTDAVKKPFDKKKWRMQRYSKKYKLEQWEEKRKKTVLREYYRQIKHEVSPKIDLQKIYEEEENVLDGLKGDELENENNFNEEVTTTTAITAPSTDNDATNMNHRKHKGSYFKAQNKYDQLKEEKLKRKEEFLKRKEDKEKALKEYRERKKHMYKKLNKKTKKGQPIMKHRMQLLLEQIQKSTTHSTT